MKFDRVGRDVPRVGRIVPRVERIVPRVGRVVPRVGREFTELGEMFPELGELFPELDEMFPELGEMHTLLHTPRHIFSPVIFRYNMVLHNIYVPVINFDRAQFLTETRANIVDVQL